MPPISGRQAICMRWAAVLSLALLGTATAAQAETINCTDVTTLAAAPPYAITAPGVYCLKADMTYASTTGAAINIETNNVVLDLNAHKLGGGPAGSGTLAYGVYVNNHGSVTVKNGLIRGFYTAVYFVGGSLNNANLVENITALANTVRAIHVGTGVHNTVRDCVVATTGGSTSVTEFAWGITNDGTSAFVTNCKVSNTFVTTGGTGRIGIFVKDGRAVNNQVIGDGGGPGTDVCLSMTSGIYKDNVVSGCITNYSGGTPVGATNYP